MQKKLIAYIITMLVIAFTVIGCIDTYAEGKTLKDFIKLKTNINVVDVFNRSDIDVLIDKKNKQEYIIVYSENGVAITPRLEKNNGKKN